ncbi:hypothetical protein A6A27_12395 [Micromonospora sp. CB01531]|nr:hypothetical protein A6A27_12395 [Micromonospora sp. CB01531]
MPSVRDDEILIDSTRKEKSGVRLDGRRVTLRDVVVVLPFVGLPAAIAFDGMRESTSIDGAPIGNTSPGNHLFLYLDLGLVLLLVIAGWARRRFRAPPGLGPFVLLLASFMPAMALTSFGPYSSYKVIQMLTVTAALVFGALVVIDRPARRVALLWAAAALGVLVAVVAVARPNPAYQVRDAVVLTGSVAITTARIIGLGAVSLLCLGLIVRRWRLVALVAAAILTVPLIMTGARGPVVALAGAGIAVVACLNRGSRWRSLLPVAALGGLLVYLISSSMLPLSVASRFDVLRGGPMDDSSEARLELGRIALDAVLRHPLGVGWGDFGSVVPPGLLMVVPGREDIIYPHNLALEVASEGGVVALGGLLLLAVSVVHVLRSRGVDPSTFAVVPVLVFAVINSMSSSDLNGNLMVWVLAAVILAARGRWGRHGRESIGRSGLEHPSRPPIGVRSRLPIP